MSWTCIYATLLCREERDASFSPFSPHFLPTVFQSEHPFSRQPDRNESRLLLLFNLGDGGSVAVEQKCKMLFSGDRCTPTLEPPAGRPGDSEFTQVPKLLLPLHNEVRDQQTKTLGRLKRLADRFLF